MTTYYSQKNGSWSDMTVWNDAAGGGGAAPANLVAMDGCNITIQANHAVLCDSDMSGFTGLLTVTITSHATDPGMLYWKNGTSGYLKVRTGYNIVGTNAAAKGRLLAKSDGVWGNTGVLAFANKAVILLEGTSILDATYLDCRFYCYEPTTKYVETYKTAYTCTTQTTDIALDTDIITFTGAPPAQGTAVCVRSSGTLPTPLRNDVIYYVRTVSGNTCKLATLNADANIVDITATGAGTLTMYDGHTNLATATMNVIQNVSAETGWTADAGHDAVVLCNWGPQAYDQQRLTLDTINAGTIVLSGNVDSVQYPLARIYLSSRNISIRSSGTTAAQAIVSAPVNGVFGCEIRNTGGSGTTFYGYAINAGSPNTITGVISGCSRGVVGGITGYYNTVSGFIIGCKTAFDGANSSLCSAEIAGCENSFSGMYNLSMSGIIFGVSNAFTTVIGAIISGSILGLNNVFSSSRYFKLKNCIINSNNHLGTCDTTFFLGGVTLGNVDVFTFDYGDKAYCRNIKNPYSLVYNTRNSILPKFGRITFENVNGVDGVMLIADVRGDIIKTLCDGTGDAPSVDPDGNSDTYCLEASNIQSNIGVYYDFDGLQIIEEQRIWLDAGPHTVTYKLQTTYAGITAGNLKLTCWYIGTDGVLTEVTNAPAIAQRADDTDWSQELKVTFTQSVEGWATFSIDLMEYESGNEVYVWPTPTVT
jgi:hypothetical protein